MVHCPSPLVLNIFYINKIRGFSYFPWKKKVIACDEINSDFLNLFHEKNFFRHDEEKNFTKN